MNEHLTQFYHNAGLYFNQTAAYHANGRVDFLRARTKLFDWMEFRIFQATLLKDIPLNADEESFLSIPRDQRIGILWQEEGDL